MFDFCWTFTLRWEGGLCDDAGDPGWITKYGVDLRMLKGMQSPMDKAKLELLGIRQPVTRQTIKDLTKTQAAGVYRYQVWDKLGLTMFPPVVQCVLFDAGVNNGNSQSVKFIQYAYNQRHAGKLAMDGKLGPKTRQAILTDDVKALARGAIDRREYFFRSLAKASPARKKFLAGWLNRVNDLRRYLGL